MSNQPDEIIIHNQDKTEPTDIQHPIVIVLDKLRSAFNVGNIFRLADSCAAERVVTCGYTATPPHPKLTKTALGAEEFIDSTHYNTSLEAVRALKSEGYQVVGIETVEGAPRIWDVTFDFPVAFVFGNEALGVEKDTLEECDLIARLPAFGQKNSLNVANCASVVIYQAIQQLENS
jgi:tRNA G18 (ribose-2'-O)-methylase SpoU